MSKRFAIYESENGEKKKRVKTSCHTQGTHAQLVSSVKFYLLIYKQQKNYDKCVPQQ